MTTIRPEAIRLIRGLGNRRVHLGAGIILTSDSGIESQYSRNHSHDVHLSFGPKKPDRENDESSWQESGGWSLLEWQRSIEQRSSLEKVEYSRHYCQPHSSPMFDKFACGYTTTFSVHDMQIIVTSGGRHHSWDLIIEHKSPSEMEEIRSNYEKYGDRKSLDIGDWEKHHEAVKNNFKEWCDLSLQDQHILRWGAKKRPSRRNM